VNQPGATALHSPRGWGTLYDGVEPNPRGELKISGVAQYCERGEDVNMTARAKKPEGVLEKVRECRFFLVQMTTHEAALDTEAFLSNLSAFLNAFQTAAFRLYGVTENRNGKDASLALQSQLRRHPEIGFLMSQRNVEVHEDGATVHQWFTVHVGDVSVPSLWGPQLGQNTDWLPSSFGSRSGQGVVIRRAAGWQFAGSPKNLIELCHDTLDAMEGFIRQALPTDPCTTQTASIVG
jgi:hypothetical protein